MYAWKPEAAGREWQGYSQFPKPSSQGRGIDWEEAGKNARKIEKNRFYH